MVNIYVLNKFEPNNYPNAVEVDTTSNGNFKDLSPFYLGPVIDPYTGEKCLRFENYWQYTKLYKEYSINNTPTDAYWDWRRKGFNSIKAIRYPMGKGAKAPIGAWYNNSLYGYISARKTIYIPIYSKLVLKTQSYAKLYKWCVEDGYAIVLRDYDGYDYHRYNLTLKQVVNDPKRKMGHAFVLAGLLTGKINDMLN